MLTLFVIRAGGGRAALDRFPEWSAKNGHRVPDSVDNGPYQYAYDTELNFFAYLQANNPLGIQFNNHMGGYRQGRPGWMDKHFFPVDERLIKGARTDADAALLVDVGGSVGHDLLEFRQKHATAPGRLILQDLPVVIGQINELDASIERMPHDFWTQQPVKGKCGASLGELARDSAPANSFAQVLERIICTLSSTIGQTIPVSRFSRI